jgi:hypothetical protein
MQQTGVQAKDRSSLSFGAVVERDSKKVQYNTAVTVTLSLALSAQLIALASGQQGHTGESTVRFDPCSQNHAENRRDGVFVMIRGLVPRHSKEMF